MNQQRQNNIGLALLIALALLVVATGAVFAAGMAQSEPPDAAEKEENWPFWGPMHGRRAGWSDDAPFMSMHDAMIEAVADATGLSVEAIAARLADGERLISIALDAGLSEEDYFNLKDAVRARFLAEALESGWITEAQYQRMLERGQGKFGGRGFGGCHRFDEDNTSSWGRGSGRGRRGGW